ncbi:MAG: YggS family pyridoxal phosphate-dependent enzyme [Alphaproteobacteria bacterium]|nr:YggS family pyridoxal phosphate-dependent enzyme [Alphaproteobacteria bacterium]
MNDTKNLIEQQEIIKQRFFQIKSQIEEKIKSKKSNTVNSIKIFPKIALATKTQPPEYIEPLLKIGHRCFAENKVQEAYNKWPLFRQDYSDIDLHLIGPLQTNKIKQALTLFDVIETIDRISLAESMAVLLKKNPKKIKFLIQVNTGNEPQKSGVKLNDTEYFIDFCLKKLALPIVGLMCIPPYGQNPIPHFKLLADLAHKYKFQELSMGMSNDFLQALDAGATEVRIGTAIFGLRK